VTYQVEVTDTYAGEANYNWVHKHTIDMPEGYSKRQLVMAAKKAEGWTGRRCETYHHGDMIEVRPRGLLQVMFITWIDK